MLVLSRKLHERILIGPDVIIEVVRIEPNLVRIGVTAPEHVAINREEVVTRDGFHGDPSQKAAQTSRGASRAR